MKVPHMLSGTVQSYLDEYIVQEPVMSYMDYNLFFSTRVKDQKKRTQYYC